VQLAIGDLARFRRIVAFPDDRDLVAAGSEVPVGAVGGDVGDAVLEPADGDLAGAEAGVLDAGEGLRPIDPPAVLAPERLRVAEARLVHPPVLGLVHVNPTLEVGRNVVELLVHGASPLRFVGAGIGAAPVHSGNV
jgi:hypothetical protein